MPSLMVPNDLLKSLNKAFKETIKQHSYFSEWKKDGTRRFWFTSDDYCAGIELGISKFWSKSGDFLIEITSGHPIATDIINKRSGVSLRDGFYCVSCEMIAVDGMDRTIANDGRWISVDEDADIPAAMSEVLRIVNRDAIPWFENMKRLEAFAAWIGQHASPYALIPLTLKMHGRNRVREDVSAWMATRPRNVDDVFDWLAENFIFDRSFCDRLRLATLQAESRYRELVVELAKDIRDFDR